MVKKELAIVMALILIISLFTACGSDKEAEKGADVKDITAVVGIVPSEESEMESVEMTEVIIPEGSTVMDALMALSDDLGDLPIEKSAKGNYVTSIGGLEEDVKGGTGWVYEVNSETVMVPANEKELNDDDHVTWLYINWKDMSE